MGRKHLFRYHILQHGWNAYLRMININYESTCPKCKSCPDVLIFDGITMGTIKSILEISIGIDGTQVYHWFPWLPESSYQIQQ